MATNGSSHPSLGETENSLEKIKRQLAAGSGRNLLQGPLVKRSETLRKWNERWMILDPITGKLEYKVRRNEPLVKGTIIFDSNSTITVSPVNFHGLPKYDGCCFYIGTPRKKQYFLCAETPAAARAWVSTLHAAQLVLKAHKEAVNSLSGSGSAQLGTVAAVVAAANSTAIEASKEIEAAMKISMRAALRLITNKEDECQMDDLTIMKETLRVKDEELQHLARELRARDSTIKEIAEKLSDTAAAAEAAASAAHAMDEERRIAWAEIERLTKESEKQREVSSLKPIHIFGKVYDEYDDVESSYHCPLFGGLHQEGHLICSLAYTLNFFNCFRVRRNEPLVKGTIIFDSNSTITVSPVNFHGLPKYDGCCFYIGTPRKKQYFLCAETPAAARAWVSTLHAAQLVLKAHKEAVNSLSGSGSAQLGTVAAVVAAANSTAMEASKEIEAAMKISMRAALRLITNKEDECQMDDLTIVKETLRVKDEELQHLARELRARDSTIKEIAEKLSDTAAAAEAAASAAHAMDEERRIAWAEIERLTKESEKQREVSSLKLRSSEEQVVALTKERDQLMKQRDSAFQEAQMWRSELAKARERGVILEAHVVRAEERARVSEADAEAKKKDAAEKGAIALREKEDLLAYVNALQSQIQRQQNSGKQMFEEKSESCSEDNVDKACLSVSRSIPVSEDREATDKVEAEVKEISLEAEGSSLDIPVVSLPVDSGHGASPPQP